MRLVILVAISLITVQSYSQRFVEVSARNPSYFVLTDGTPYIPVGINLINPSGGGSNPDSAFYEIEQWMKNLAANGGNYIRIWLSQSFWDIETAAGKYDENKAQRIDRYLALARKYGLKVKLTLEHFRSLTLKENPQNWATKFVYHKSHGGPLDSIGEYIATTKGRKLFLDKLGYYQKRYGSDTLFFGWELWNEMNAMKGPEDELFFEWNESMLQALKKHFPHNLAMQSLGSYDGPYAKPVYDRLMNIKGNEVAQVHRYLDLGAEYEICHSPMDVICASAIHDLKTLSLGKPVILAETGAVEPNHAGPSKYYAKDTAGILLHDMLFAPFFSGSAGAGMSWHWESYVHKNNLWYHYGRFKEAVKNVDPIAEQFTTSFQETKQFRIYSLEGNNTVLSWVRDKESDWRSELDKGSTAPLMKNKLIKLPSIKEGHTVHIYDPWNNRWSTAVVKNGYIRLPEFKRSIVIRVKKTDG
jgi:hypothetical protein